MNERIRELARQSTGAGTVYMLEDEWTKFAELIVRECMELGDKALQDGKWPGDVLKEHFGVE